MLGAGPVEEKTKFFFWTKLRSEHSSEGFPDILFPHQGNIIMRNLLDQILIVTPIHDIVKKLCLEDLS